MPWPWPLLFTARFTVCRGRGLRGGHLSSSRGRRTEPRMLCRSVRRGAALLERRPMRHRERRISVKRVLLERIARWVTAWTESAVTAPAAAFARRVPHPRRRAVASPIPKVASVIPIIRSLLVSVGDSACSPPETPARRAINAFGGSANRRRTPPATLCAAFGTAMTKRRPAMHSANVSKLPASTAPSVLRLANVPRATVTAADAVQRTVQALVPFAPTAAPAKFPLLQAASRTALPSVVSS